MLPRPQAQTEHVDVCPHSPTERQRAFLALRNLEALYGGAAGGGKSDALLMAASEYVHVPGYAALLFRRTYADLSLPGALMDRAADWWRGQAAWRETTKTWEFPSGATVTFGYLDTDKDRFRYQGAELQFLAFDEATQFSEVSYRYLLSRLRRLSGSSVPLRARLASNPGGIGHEWVKARFVDPGDPSRPFVPARLEDNPYLDREEYEKSLAELDPITRRQLRYGDWSATPEGGLFRPEWFSTIDAVPVARKRIRYWDLAASADTGDWTAGALVGLDPAGRWYIEDMRRMQGRPAEIERLIQSTADRDGQAVEIAIEQEPGSSGVIAVDHYIRHVLRGFAVRGQRATGDKITRARPVSAQAEAGNVALLRGGWNGPLLDELTAFPTTGVHDDQVDAISGGFALLAGANRFRPGFAVGARPVGIG